MYYSRHSLTRPSPSVYRASEAVYISNNCSQLNQCLERRDYSAIIKDKDLFFLAYCKTILNHKNKDFFSFTCTNMAIHYSGEQHIYAGVRKITEELRKVLLKGLENKNCIEFIVIDTGVEIFYRDIDDKDGINDFKNTPFNGKFFYEKYFKSFLSNLINLIGANYIECKSNPLIESLKQSNKSYINVEIIRINWQRECHLVYPIKPLIIPTQENIGEALYSLYQSQMLCDYTLVSGEKSVKVNSSILYLNGGPVIQNMLTSVMKENENKVISFEDYSHETVLSFIDFIYLGGSAFLEKVTSTNIQHEMNVIELFELANRFQLTNLVNCCTNLISLIATIDDLEIIQYNADKYNNEHLKQLYQHFNPSENENIVIIKA